MNVQTSWTVDNGQLTLVRGDEKLKPLDLFFEHGLKATQLVIAAVTQTSADGRVTLRGQTDAWGSVTAQATLEYAQQSGRFLSLSLTKAIDRFAGLELEHVALRDLFQELRLELTLSANDVPSQGTALVRRRLSGVLQPALHVRIPFVIENPAAGQPMLVEATWQDGKGPGLTDLAGLLGSGDNPEGDLAWLPKELRDTKLLSLEDLQFRLDPRPGEGLNFVSVTLQLLAGRLWPIIPGVPWLQVGGLWATLSIDYPLQPAYRLPRFKVGGAIELGGGIIEVTARWPDFAISGTLKKGSQIALGELLKQAGLGTQGLPSGKEALGISRLSFTAEPTDEPKRFSFLIAIDNVWSFKLPTLGDPAIGQDLGGEADAFLAIDQLSLRLDYDGSKGLGGQFTGKFSVAGVDLFMQATHTSPTSGWRFEGGTSPGAEIPIGVLFDDLAQKAKVSDLPAQLREAVIKNLDVVIDTPAKSFDFTAETDFPVGGDKTLSLVLSVKLMRGQSSYSSFVSGKLLVSTLEFDVIFNKDGSSTILLGSYQNLAGGKLPIAKLVKAIGAGPDAVKAADKIEIDLKDALFAYFKPAPAAGEGDTTATEGVAPAEPAAPAKAGVLFALDVGGGVNLSNLPLVGRLLPKGQSLRATFQPIVTSENFTQARLQAINALAPSGATVLPEPEAGILQRLFISGTLRIGDKSVELGLNVSKDGRSGQLVAATTDAGGSTQSTATARADLASKSPPPAKLDSAKWIDVQKTLGPLTFKRVGFQLDSGILWFLLDASFTAGGLNISLDGLAAGSTLDKLEPHFRLRGMGIDFKQGGVEIGGSFLRVPGQDGQPDEYDGLALIRTEAFGLSALGSYTRRQGHPSLFIYGVLDYPLGGPVFFFVTGLAAGFGYNRVLRMPAIGQVANFPLVSQAVSSPGKPQPLSAVLGSLRAYVPPQVGETFLCAGLSFTSFELIDSFALLSVQFGRRFEIDLLGLSTALVPPRTQSTPLAEIQMALKLTFLPQEGFFGVRAQLTANSFVLSRACHLTGGFAFYSWFKDGYLGGREGDFVITVGGYHPAFKAPSYYPVVPRVGFNWIISSNLSLKGGLYYALTSSALMAGGGLQAVFHSGPLKAWFLIGADFLISWKPYHYDARVYIDLGVSFTFWFFGTRTISLDLGADLHIWGPDFSGVAKIHILFFTVTIRFGAGAKQLPQPVDWEDFRNSFLPADKKVVDPGGGTETETAVTGIRVKSGLVKKPSGDDAYDLGVINPKQFSLATHSAVPIKSVVWNDVSAKAPGNLDIHIGSMAIVDDSLVSEHSIRVVYHELVDGVVQEVVKEDLLKIEPILKGVPEGLWGKQLTPDLNGKKVIRQAVVGFEILPAKEPTPGHTKDIERADLAFEIQLKDGAYDWALPLGPLAVDAPEDARQQIENGIAAQQQIERRRAALEAWGFHPDRDVDLHPGYAANLMGEPALVAGSRRATATAE